LFDLRVPTLSETLSIDLSLLFCHRYFSDCALKRALRHQLLWPGGTVARSLRDCAHWRDSTVLFAHYRRAVTRRNAERYWQIKPVRVAKGKIVPMTKAG
jgi:hypothetical protein